MPEPRKPDRWNSLLETLGVPAGEPAKAEVTPLASSDAPEPIAAPPPRPQPISMLPPEKAKAAPKPKAAPPQAKSPSYWSRIAGALGLEVPAEPEPPAPEVLPPKVEAPAPPPPRTAEPPRSFERGPHALESAPRESAPASRTPLEEMFGAPRAEADVFRGAPREESPRLREPNAPRNRDDDESGSVLDYDVETGSDLSLGQSAGREEGSRREEEMERDPNRRRRRRGRGRRGRGEEREMPPPRHERHEEEIEPAGEEADLAYGRDEELDLELGLDQGDELAPRDERSERDRLPPTRGRDEREEREDRGRGRHRRGRGGRDRDYSSSRSGGYSAEEKAAPPYAERGPAPARDDRYDEGPDDVDLGGELDEGDDEHAAGAPSHKKIPTWEEAVGILVEANMASRAANPERDRGGRGGRGRGRGRGR